MFETTLNLIKKHDTIILHRHKNPDGDALGAQLGLKYALTDNFPDKRIFCVGDGMGRYSFMDEYGMDSIADDCYINALAIILDTPSRSMLSDERCFSAKSKVRLDHHIFCEALADVEVIDTSYESCSGLVTEMIIEAGWSLGERAASALYTGMVTDSGRFRYDSVTSNTFRLASFLMQQKIDTSKLFRHLYADDYQFICLRAKYILKIAFTDSGRVAYIYTSAKEIEEFDKDPYMLSRAMVNVMSDIRGVDAWVNFTETPDGVLSELRSSVYEIHSIAKKYGGGGHAKACGATLKNRQEAMLMLADIDKLLENQI